MSFHFRRTLCLVFLCFAGLSMQACGRAQDTGEGAPARLASTENVHQPGVSFETLRETAADDGAKELRLAAGNFVLEDALLLSSNTAVRGAGPGITVLKVSEGGGVPVAIGNTDTEEGGENIVISDLTIDCNKAAEMGIAFSRIENLHLQNVEAKNCLKDGIRISGQGRQTRGIFLSNISSHDNRDDGVIILWASREAMVSNLRSYQNGRHGVVFDHSEGAAVNVIANRNGGRGIFFRNLFAGNYTNMRATRNGQHGIYVQGFVSSTGASWQAMSNSWAQEGEFDEIYLTGADDLSYGVSRNSVVTGVVVGGMPELGKMQARYGVTWETEAVDLDIADIRFGITTNGDTCRAPSECVMIAAE